VNYKYSINFLRFSIKIILEKEKMYKNCFECPHIKIKNQRGRHSFYCPKLTKILGKYFFIDNMGHRPKICPLLKKGRNK